VNQTILVIGYGSLLSGLGLLAERRGGKSRLVARDAAPTTLRNARRGLAKPSSHGRYLAMDIEPIDRKAPITAHAGIDGGGVGALALEFDRASAPLIAAREEYDPAAFMRLLAMADAAGRAVGEFLLQLAERARFDLLAYRTALHAMLGYTSPGYVFHPAPLDDGRVGIIAIGSGFDGSGDANLQSRRQMHGMDRLLKLGEALTQDRFAVDIDGQLDYYSECLLGGMHGVCVSDLLGDAADGAPWMRDLAHRMAQAAADEGERFLRATSLDRARYQARFRAASDPALAALLNGARDGR
jgi:hypothetical protein